MLIEKLNEYINDTEAVVAAIKKRHDAAVQSKNELEGKVNTLSADASEHADVLIQAEGIIETAQSNLDAVKKELGL